MLKLKIAADETIDLDTIRLSPIAIQVQMMPRGCRWSQFSLRMLLIAVTIAAFVLTYLGSYCRISRRGMQEARDLHIAGFFYVPFDEALATKDLTTHYRRAAFFAPVNWLDQWLLGAPGPVRGVTWDLQ